MSEILFNAVYMSGIHAIFFVLALFVKPRHNYKVHFIAILVPLVPALALNWLAPFNLDTRFLYTMLALFLTISSAKDGFTAGVKKCVSGVNN